MTTAKGRLQAARAKLNRQARKIESDEEGEEEKRGSERS